MKKLFYTGVILFWASTIFAAITVLTAGDRIFQPHEALLYVTPIMIGMGMAFWSGAHLLHR